MARKREIAIDPQHGSLSGMGHEGDSARLVDSELDSHKAFQVASSPRAENPIEALMQCAPGEEPALSQQELLPLREIIEDAIDTVLTSKERWVFNALAVEKMSVRQLGEQLSIPKSTIHRIYQRACAALAAALETNDLIIQHLKGRHE